ARIARQQRNYALARTFLEEALFLDKEVDYKVGTAFNLAVFGGIALEAERPARAAKLLAVANRVIGSNKLALPAYRRVILAQLERDMGAVRGQLDKEAFEAAWAEGQAMTLEQAVACALSEQA